MPYVNQPFIQRRVGQIIGDHGETVVLARDGEGTTITLKGKRLRGALEDAGNTATQQSFRVLLGTAELLASAWTVKAPQVDDVATVDGRRCSVLDVQPRKDGDTVALYELIVAG